MNLEKGKRNWIITGLILPIIAGIIVEIFSSIPVFKTVINYIRKCFRFLTIDLSIPVWLLVIAIFLVSGFVYGITNFLNKETDKHDYEDYYSDRIFGVDWQWDWINNEVKNLVPLCPECSYQPTLNLGFEPQTFSKITDLKCDHCGFEMNWEDSPDFFKSRVIREIHRKIRTNEYETDT